MLIKVLVFQKNCKLLIVRESKSHLNCCNVLNQRAQPRFCIRESCFKNITDRGLCKLFAVFESEYSLTAEGRDGTG